LKLPAKLKRNALAIASASLLIMAFQNCGSSSFQNLETVNGEPLSSLLPPTSDTAFNGGQDFRVLSLSNSSSEMQVEFSVERSVKDRYLVKSLTSLSNCAFKGPNAAEDLLHIADVTIISHPATLSSSINVCASNAGKDYFYQLGNNSAAVFIVFKNKTENCYSGDPEKLIAQGESVFVADNMFEDDIINLVNNVSDNTSSSSSCQTVNIGTSD